MMTEKTRLELSAKRPAPKLSTARKPEAIARDLSSGNVRRGRSSRSAESVSPFFAALVIAFAVVLFSIVGLGVYSGPSGGGSPKPTADTRSDVGAVYAAVDAVKADLRSKFADVSCSSGRASGMRHRETGTVIVTGLCSVDGSTIHYTARVEPVGETGWRVAEVVTK